MGEGLPTIKLIHRIELTVMKGFISQMQYFVCIFQPNPCFKTLLARYTEVKYQRKQLFFT